MNAGSFFVSFASALKAGTAQGCANLVQYGVIGNEHGTWLFGRNGWCDGAPVSRWTIDISDMVTANTTLNYRGLYEGETPNPPKGGNPAYILMQSYLVLYR